MRDLIELSRKIIQRDNDYKSHHLTFITRRNRIISIGRNFEDRSHTFAYRWGYIDARIHSEVDAIIKAKNAILRYCNLKIWNVRIDRHNALAMSKPCARCELVIRSVEIREVYYTCSTNIETGWLRFNIRNELSGTTMKHFSR